MTMRPISDDDLQRLLDERLDAARRREVETYLNDHSEARARVDRLVADGVIKGFTVQVDPAVDGLGTEAYVELFCRGTVSPQELQRILGTVPEVVDAGTVTGSADAIVHMRSRDIPSLEEALERVRNAPNVDHTRSAIVLSKLISRRSA